MSGSLPELMELVSAQAVSLMRYDDALRCVRHRPTHLHRLQERPDATHIEGHRHYGPRGYEPKRYAGGPAA